MVGGRLSKCVTGFQNGFNTNFPLNSVNSAEPLLGVSWTTICCLSPCFSCYSLVFRRKHLVKQSMMFEYSPFYSEYTWGRGVKQTLKLVHFTLSPSARPPVPRNGLRVKWPEGKIYWSWAKDYWILPGYHSSCTIVYASVRLVNAPLCDWPSHTYKFGVLEEILKNKDHSYKNISIVKQMLYAYSTIVKT